MHANRTKTNIYIYTKQTTRNEPTTTN